MASIGIDDTFHYHLDGSSEQVDLSLAFPTKLNLEIQDLDISLVNGLRRTIFADVPTVSISHDINLSEDQNITVLNSDYLKDRFRMVPIHIDNLEEMEKYLPDNNKIIFKICDPNVNTWDHPLKNEENKSLPVTTRDIVILRELEQAQGAMGEAGVPQEEEEEEEEEEEQGVSQEEEEQGVMGEARGQAKRWERLNSENFFKYPDMYLAHLKKGESLYMIMRPEVGIGREHASWHAAVFQYRFKPRKLLEDPNWQPSLEYDSNYNPVKDRQDYPKAETRAGVYGSPQVFQIGLEYNGHMRPSLAWLSSIQKLSQKITNFQEQVRKIEERSEQVTETLRVEFSPKNQVENLITFTVTDEDHTLGNIIFSHYLYNLEDFLRGIYNNQEQYLGQVLKSFSHYRIPHPLENILIIMLKIPQLTTAEFTSGFQALIKEGENPYDEEFYQNNPTMRLLMIVLERVINTLKELEKEAKIIDNKMAEAPVSADVHQEEEEE